MTITPIQKNFLTFARAYAFACGSSAFKINATDLSVVWLLAIHGERGFTLLDIYNAIPEKDVTTLCRAVKRLVERDVLSCEKKRRKNEEGRSKLYSVFRLGKNAEPTIAYWCDSFSGIASRFLE